MPETMYWNASNDATELCIMKAKKEAESWLTTDTDLLDALYETMSTDDEIVQMVTADHSNILGDHSPKFVIETALRFADIKTLIPTVQAHHIIFPPIATDEMATRRLQGRLMRPGATFVVPKRGIAVPWLGPDPRHPEPMSCSECIGVDHYNDDCHILHSPSSSSSPLCSAASSCM
ncbi:hypothetical protein B0H13DRAFT_2362640 [Mycena leptocephala]|nr:hypothetical protein B0H13DRAFT_2362640 [Mycena leptocephala]